MRYFQDLSLEDLQIINEFLSIIIVWHVTIPTFVSFLVFLFLKEIKILFGKISHLRAGSFEFQAGETDKKNTPNSKKEKELRKEIYKLRNDMDDERSESDKLIKEYDASLNAALDQAEFWEFEHFRFDYNMRMVLQLITRYLLGFRRDSFLQSFTLPQNIPNQQAVKEEMFDTLLRFGFIIQKGDMFIGTKKTHRFLRHIGIGV